MVNQIVEIETKKARTANSTYPKGGALCFADTFVQAESLVLRLNICAIMPAHRKSANLVCLESMTLSSH